MVLFFKVLIRTIKDFLDDDPMTYASSLAFYTVVSLPAILILGMGLLTSAYDKNEIQTTVLSQLSKYLGPNTVEQAENILENATTDYSGIIPQIIGFFVLAFSATTVFASLQGGINSIWGVKPDPSLGIMKFIKDRVLSFAMIVSVGFVLLVSFVIDSGLAILSDWLAYKLQGLGFIFAMLINGIVSLVVISAIFGVIFKVLPDVKTKWSNIWYGAVFTAVMFVAGKWLIEYYLTTTDVGSPYGASGSLVVFLFWVYYSSILILFGAKFTYVYTMFHEDEIKSSTHAVFVSEEVVDPDVKETSEN